jgi:D-sedoheptulose 7-phosphate isomerase
MVMNFDDFPMTSSNKGLLTSPSMRRAPVAFRSSSSDPFVRQELVETTYHMLWELVHVFLDHIGGSTAGAGASSFLYPFLDEEPRDLANMEADVRGSVLLKGEEIRELRSRTVERGRSGLAAAATALAAVHGRWNPVRVRQRRLHDRRDGCRRDSARHRKGGPRARRSTSPPTARSSRRSRTTSAPTCFGRQIIAYAKEGDTALALDERRLANIIEALTEARRRGLLRSCFGYDGAGGA